MRTPFVFALILAAAAARADRDISVPKGHKILDGDFRLDYLGSSGEKPAMAWLGTGIMKAFEADLQLVRTNSERWTGTFEFSYNFAPPIIDVSPGLSFGIVDGLNKTLGGRAAYVALTFYYGNQGELNQDVPTEATLGLWTRKSGLGFFSLRLPFAEQFSLIAEHDSDRLAAGFELRPVKGLSAKMVFETGRTLMGLTLNHRF